MFFGFVVTDARPPQDNVRQASRYLIERGGAYVTTLPTLTFFRDKLVSVAAPTNVHFVIVKPRP